MQIFLEKNTENYRRFKLRPMVEETPRNAEVKIVSKDMAGKLVAERVLDDVWRIELMTVYPERQGYGTLLLKHAVTELQCSKIVTYAITANSIEFFKKNGFVKDGEHTEHHLVLTLKN